MGTELRPSPRSGPSWTTVVAVVCSLAGVAALVLAWQQPGFPEVPPQPTDMSVWIVNDSLTLVGRVNTGIGELDSAALVRGTSEVLQDPMDEVAGSVLIVDQTKHELQVLDTATVTFGSRVSIPDDAVASLRGGTLAVADRMDGRLWVGDAATVGSVDARLTDPQATLGALPVLAISTLGTVFATAAGAQALVQAVPGADPISTPFADGPLALGGIASGGADPADDLQITTVGEAPVVLDRADSSLRVEGRRIELPPLKKALLQLPGPAAADVLIATADGLVAVDLGDGVVSTLATMTGTPTAPVVSGGCRFGAWLPVDESSATAANGLVICGTDAPQISELSRSAAVTALDFHQRGSSVVLNDSGTGISWIATDGFRRVDNWNDVKPDADPNDTATIDDLTTNADLPRLPPDCTAVDIGAPGAMDDEFGVRAGRATVLRVLDNDPSVDCTSVVIDSVSPLPPASGTVAIVAGGSAIQVTVPVGSTGNLPPIEYQVGNGLGDVATARVLVQVVPKDVVDPPEMVRRSAVTTEVNGTVSYNVLDDYVSPTGDDLYLLSAATESADVVSLRADGTITYRSTGTGEGTEVPVEFVVSDGVAQSAGTLTVAIAPADSTTPVAYPSFTTAVIGTAAIAYPLRSVVSAAVEPVTISTVRPEPDSEGATARLDPQNGSVTITASEPGSYYLTFEAATGGRGVTGVLRADFVEPNDSSRSVVPMTDVAYLTPGGQTVLDPLANDTDPDGQGLAVREVDLPADAQITAAVVDLHLVQVSAPRTPRETVLFGYSVFDGTSTKVGQIRVVPVPAPKRIPPPLASPITATVRAGDVVTIPVAEFASSQDGSPVTAELDPAQLADIPGRAFSTGDAIRYLSPADAEPGPVSFTYTAVAGSSTPLEPVQTVSTVTITVTAADPARNSAPNPPRTVTARVFARGAISISVPLAGIDPDGDWVVLHSLEQPELPLGETALSGADTLSYKAFDVAGVDRIRYLAVDPSGLTVIGEITVLVVEPSDSARPPVAPDLAVSVRPGASIRIDPLSVVVDPGGQRVELASPAFTATDELQVEVDDQSLIVTAPAEPTVASLRYAVVNSKGLTASGSVKVTVSPDAPTPAPVAVDVFVRPDALGADKKTVDVDVSGSITNRSGRSDQLTVSVDPLSAAKASKIAPQLIRVTVAPVRQIVAYEVVDAYGSMANAFIVIPPQQELVGPQLIAGAGAIQVDAGHSVDVLISDYVTVGGAGEPAISAAPLLRSTQGSAVRTSPTTLTLSAPSSAGGEAALYVPIEDGAGSVVTMTLAVQIHPRLVPPPQLDSTDLQIEAGTSAPVDLAALTTTFDEQQADSITYAVGPGSAGIETKQDGSTVTVSARPDVPRGTEIAVPIEVKDGDGRDGKAVLTVTVTGSRKPLATVVDQQVAEGRAGVEVVSDMLTGSFDPIGLGLTVTGITVTEGVGGIAAGPTLTGSKVKLTPAAGFVGDIVVAAQIADGTKDPERVVTAQLRVSIQDRPSTPGTPSLVEGTLEARSVQLAWAPADANGAAIQGYTVVGSGLRQDCPGAESACVIGGLVPGQAYVFVVTARNAVGESSPSAPSAVIVPDAVPSVPAAPVTKYVGRGQLSVSWAVPTGEFTPVTSMSVQVLRSDSVVEVRDNVGSSATFDGLDPAAAYRFQVRATNQQGTSEWSAASDAIVPSGVPGAPSALAAQFVFGAGQRGIQISWGPPQDLGGEAVQGYQVLLNGDKVASGGSDFLRALVPTGASDPEIAVFARNGRGEGVAAVVRVPTFISPTQVVVRDLTPGDRSLAAKWSKAASPGSEIERYDYQLNGGRWVSAGLGTEATISGLINGTSYQVVVRACNKEGSFGEDVRCGPPSVAASGTPFGALAPPTVDATLTGDGDRQVSATWSFPAEGNGRVITSRTVKLSGAVTADVDPAKSPWTSDDLGLGKTVTITVQYCVKDGTCSNAVTDEVTTSTFVSLATVPVGTSLGSCGKQARYGGEWLTEAECAPGTWVAAPNPIDVVCRASGVAYPIAPLATDTKDQWYRTTDKYWHRLLAVVSPSISLPEC